MVRPTVLSIAGSDSSGGAGIQADLKSIVANGGYPATVLTAVTAQNTRGVRSAEPVSLELIRDQLQAVFDDLKVAACKTGMLADEKVIGVVAGTLAERGAPHYVCDPVMISKTGFSLLPESCVGALRDRLFPLACLVTPNVHEAEALSGIPVNSVEDAARAGRRILEYGPGAVLVKGGHLVGGPATDVLVTAAGEQVVPGEWIESKHTHGTGCTYSAAIATHLAGGAALTEAIATAKIFVTEAIRHGLAVGEGTGPTDPFFFFRRDAAASRWLERLQELGDA